MLFFINEKQHLKSHLFKRCLAFILSVATIFPTVETGNIFCDNSGSVHAVTNDVLYGDVNSDSKIDILLKWISGMPVSKMLWRIV